MDEFLGAARALEAGGVGVAFGAFVAEGGGGGVGAGVVGVVVTAVGDFLPGLSVVLNF